MTRRDRDLECKRDESEKELMRLRSNAAALSRQMLDDFGHDYEIFRQDADTITVLKVQGRFTEVNMPSPSWDFLRSIIPPIEMILILSQPFVTLIRSMVASIELRFQP
jgi:hypothetical protein